VSAYVPVRVPYIEPSGYLIANTLAVRCAWCMVRSNNAELMGVHLMRQAERKDNIEEAVDAAMAQQLRCPFAVSAPVAAQCPFISARSPRTQIEPSQLREISLQVGI
jgi:hypothetical protein